MANFAVAASNDTIERANRVMELYAQDGDEKEDILNRIFDLAESESVRGTHELYEESWIATDEEVHRFLSKYLWKLSLNDVII